LEEKRNILRGDGVVDGIVLDKAIVYNPEKISIPKTKLHDESVADEIKRYKKALGIVKRRLKSDQKKILNEIGHSEADILQSHIVITEDPFFTNDVPFQIAQKKRNAEWVIMDGLKSFLDTFKNIDNIYFKERGRDIEDVSLRITRRLKNEDGHAVVKDLKGILVVTELIPSMIMYINTERVKGIVSEMGSETSHATILAKSLGIPVIINAKEATKKIKNGEQIIVDGHAGYVILHPSVKAVHEYQKIQENYNRYQKSLVKTHELPAVTLDNVRITLNANIEIVLGAAIALRYGAEGVGLFRTELPFIIHNKLLSEEEQFAIYKSIVKQYRDKPVTIRTLDIGGDKFFPFQQSIPLLEANPFLGLRSIRVSLLKPDIFRTQIRALLRASAYGKVNILLPMISSYEEMEKIMAIIQEEKFRLKKKDVVFDEKIKIGAMIEIPSAALLSEHIIEVCDFLSIGTNDLVQYTLAVDRTNENVASYYLPENPAVLKLIEITARSAVMKGKPCAVCGELSGDPLFTPFFLGAGITELSMEPKLIPQIKKIIRNMTIKEARELTEKVLRCKKVEEIKKIFIYFFNSHNDEKTSDNS